MKWVKAMAGLNAHDKLPEDAVHIATATNPEGKKLYMAKGIDPFYGPLFRIKPVDSGIVHGRRAGTAPRSALPSGGLSSGHIRRREHRGTR